MEIFLKAGFSIELIGQRTPTESLYRWRETYAKYGEAALRRGIGSTGRRSGTESSAEEKLKQAEARIKLLEAENELLKKLEALEKRNNKELTPSERFQLINQTIRKHDLRRLTRYLCQTAEVSSSGYYRWCSSEDSRQLRETADQYDFQLIKEHFESLNGKVGALVIKMWLEKLNGTVMNHKKIRRIMRKFGLVATIRQANPYRKMGAFWRFHRVS